jgi:hypothetical protein
MRLLFFVPRVAEPEESSESATFERSSIGHKEAHCLAPGQRTRKACHEHHQSFAGVDVRAPAGGNS